MTEHQTIIVETSGRVGIITLNRPKALNALNTELMNEVVGAVREFDVDQGIGAIVITGSEKAFAAGADIKEMSSKSYADVVNEQFFGAWDELSRARTPIIAAGMTSFQCQRASSAEWLWYQRARASTNPSFTNSAGWMRVKPRFSQFFAPPAV